MSTTIDSARLVHCLQAFFLVAALAALCAAPPLTAQTSRPAKQTYTFKSVPGCDIQADVYRPSGDKTPRPVVFWIHGGALIVGHRKGIRADHLEQYLKEGYVVVSIDYRLAPETKLPEIISDVEDAYAWVRKEGPELFSADPDRIAVIGHSAGGYLTLMLGFRGKPRPAALVSFYGYGDITADWYTKPDAYYASLKPVPKEQAYSVVGGPVVANTEGPERGAFYLYCRQHGLWRKEVAGVDPGEHREFFDRFNPQQNVSAEYPATLLLHGDKDTDVPFEQSVQMAAELERHGVEHRLIRIAGGPHGFDSRTEDPQVPAAFGEVLVFLRRHLQP